MLINNAVTLSEQGFVATVTMTDQLSKNAFSPALIDGLDKAFKLIRESTSLRCVILTGYDNYFCCGGIKKDLESKIQAGQAVFEKGKVYDLLINCPIPVVSAMQGHALGAGFVFGLTADVIVMAEECIYSANFMNFDFTPGFGATYIVPLKVGKVLGTEMLLSAKNYYGSDLKARGANMKILGKNQVLEEANKIATNLSQKSRKPLALLKKHLNQDIAGQLLLHVEQELEMHQQTLYEPSVIKKIQHSY